MFKKTGEASHFDNALKTVDIALEEYRAAMAAFYIEEAGWPREKILAAKGTELPSTPRTK